MQMKILNSDELWKNLPPSLRLCCLFIVETCNSQCQTNMVTSSSVEQERDRCCSNLNARINVGIVPFCKITEK